MSPLYRGLLLGALIAALTACSLPRPDRAALVASGITSHWLCSTTFVSGANPDRSYADMIRPRPGMGLVAWALRYHVDRTQKEVSTTIAGGFTTRALYRDQLGCTLTTDDQPPAPITLPPPDTTPAALPETAGPAVVVADNPALRAALAHAFAEPAKPPFHNTHAVVVLQHGKIIGEQYAPGYGPDTPLMGFSMTKSVTSALIGILVRQGRLKTDQQAPITVWRDPTDPRHSITIDQLLRQTTGLDLPQRNNGFDRTSQIMYTERDKAAAAAAAPLAMTPGSRWNYSDTNYVLLSRILRDAVGGDSGQVLRFARHELFAPLGMHHVTLEFDASGTPIGSSHMLASARDWARFGQLYLNDGMAGSQRILPPGWVGYSSTPTLATGYGAGFWTNRVPGLVPGWGVHWGLPSAPPDTFFARGFMGQFIVVVPSAQLVVVRLSSSQVQGDDIDATDQLVAEVLAAVQPTATAGR